MRGPREAVFTHQASKAMLTHVRLLTSDDPPKNTLAPTNLLLRSSSLSTDQNVRVRAPGSFKEPLRLTFLSYLRTASRSSSSSSSSQDSSCTTQKWHSLLLRICGIWIDNQKCKTSGAVEVRVQSFLAIPDAPVITWGHKVYNTQCMPVTTYIRNQGFWVYGFSLWNHWLPTMVVTGCPGIPSQ